jgi:hypothetical protein
VRREMHFQDGVLFRSNAVKQYLLASLTE